MMWFQPNWFQKSETAGTGPVCFKWDQCDDRFPYCRPTTSSRWWRVPVRLVAPATNNKPFPQLGHGIVHSWKTFRPVYFPMSLLKSRNSRSSLCWKSVDGIFQFEMIYYYYYLSSLLNSGGGRRNAGSLDYNLFRGFDQPPACHYWSDCPNLSLVPKTDCLGVVSNSIDDFTFTNVISLLYAGKISRESLYKLTNSTRFITHYLNTVIRSFLGDPTYLLDIPLRNDRWRYAGSIKIELSASRRHGIVRST